MKLPDNIPTVNVNYQGATPTPSNTDWWIEVATPERIKPTRLFLMYQGQVWTMWECASHRNRSDDDHINQGIQQLVEFSRALAAQIEPLRKVGRSTEHALRHGVDPHRDYRTGKLPADITQALNHRSAAIETGWESLRPVVDKTHACLDKGSFHTWASGVMDSSYDTSLNFML